MCPVMKSFQQLNHFDTDEQIDAGSTMPGLFSLRSVLFASAVVSQMLFGRIVVAQTAAWKLVAKQASSTAAAGIISTKLEQPPIPAKKFSLGLGIDYSASSVQEEATEREANIEYSLSPSYQISESLTVVGSFSVVQQQFGARESLVGDSGLCLCIKGFEFSEELKSAHSIRSLLPTSQKSQETDRFQGGLRVGNGITASLGSRVELIYDLGIQRNFHEFTVNSEGEANLQWQVRHRLDFNLKLTEQLSLKSWGLYTQGSTYKNSSRYGFSTDISAELKVTEEFGISAGFSNDGAALRSNGVDSNISVYDDKSATYHGGMSYTF
jgi:hypothetical protein